MKSADKILSKRYAGAYMDLDGSKEGGRAANKHGEAAAAVTELEKVRNATSRFRRLFLHPLVGCDDKCEILSKLLSKELMVSRAAGFVRLLIREKRFYLLETVLEDCMKLYNAYAGVVRAEVVSRHPLSGEDAKHIGTVLSASTGKEAHLTQIVSERVLGGVEIRLGDLLIDATVKGRLERLKNSIII